MAIPFRSHRWAAPSALLAMAAVTALALTACSGGEASPQPSADEDVTVALSTFANETALGWQANAVTFPVYSPVYDTLLGARMEGGERAPSLTTSIDESEDGLTYTLHLREGVEFQKDYGDFTSEDVLYNFDKYMDPASTGSTATTFQSQVESFEAPDDSTVVVKTKAINRAFIDSFLTSWMLSKAYVDEVGEEVAAREPVGTGPYDFVSSTPGAEIVYSRNDGYWGDPAGFADLTLRLIPDPSTQLSSLQAGEVDVIQVSGDAIGQAEGGGYQILSSAGAQQQWIVLPGLSGADKPDYDPSYPWVGAPDPASQEKASKVRQAMAMSIDKQTIIDAVFGGYGNLDSWGFYIPEGDPGWSADWEPIGYDVDAAKDLLAEAGYPDGFSINLADIGETPDHPTLTQAIGQYWTELGLDVELQKFDFSKAITDVSARTADYAFLYATPAAVSSTAVFGMTSDAVFRFVEASPETDATLASLSLEPDEDTRWAGVTDLMNRWIGEQFGLQVATRDATFAVSDSVGGWTLQPGNGAPNNYQGLEPASGE